MSAPFLRPFLGAERIWNMMAQGKVFKARIIPLAPLQNFMPAKTVDIFEDL